MNFFHCMSSTNQESSSSNEDKYPDEYSKDLNIERLLIQLKSLQHLLVRFQKLQLLAFLGFVENGLPIHCILCPVLRNNACGVETLGYHACNLILHPLHVEVVFVSFLWFCKNFSVSLAAFIASWIVVS